MGAVPVLARGLGHTVPTYLRRRPGSPSNGFLGSALDVSRVANDSMTTLADPKAYLRRSALSRRRALDARVRRAFSARLVDEGMRLARLWNPGVVSAFYPIGDEPDALALLRALADEGFTTALPVTARGRPLTFRRWRPGDATFPGPMNIPEPPPEAGDVAPDLLFTPLAAFDRRGHRIGYGAGHYDRTLAGLRARGRIHAVGVAYSVCEVEAVPDEPHDQRLDFILTESELIDARDFG
jgi:5-formyltetrahydrofolate cyclo-ligase